jgi:hypothetical protein
MLPNFTVVICGAILTVLMLAVAGSGLIDPQTHTRIGAMPEIGRPMMQRMIAEPAARGHFAALEMSRRTEELLRLRDLAPATVEPAPAAEHNAAAQPATDSTAPLPFPPSNTAAVPATSTEAVPAVGAEAVPAAEAAPAADAVPAAEAVPAAVAETASAEALPAAAAEKAPGKDGVGLLAGEDSKLAAEPAVEPLSATPPIVAPPIVAAPFDPPAAASERVAAAPSSEPLAVTEPGEAVVEMPTSPPLELALADPAAPAGEAPAKSARPAEPEGAAPVRRLMPRFVPLLPRIIPSLVRHAPPRLAPALPRVMPTLARHIHTARAEVAKPDFAKAPVAPRKPVRHVIRQVQHRAQRAYVAPGTAGSPYSSYSVTSGAQYR